MNRSDHRKVKRTLDALPGKHFFLSLIDGRITVMSDMKLYEIAPAMSTLMSKDKGLFTAMKKAVEQVEMIMDKTTADAVR